MKFRTIFLSAFHFAVALALGCASAPRVAVTSDAAAAASTRIEAAHRHARNESETWNPTMEPLRHRPWLNANREARLRLELLREHLADEDYFSSEASKLLESMLQRGAALHRRTQLGRPLPEDNESDLAILAQAERDYLSSLGAPDDRRKWINEMIHDLPPANPGKRRLWQIAVTFPATPILYLWIARHAATEDKGPYPHEFNSGTIYRPAFDRDREIFARIENASDEDLLAFYSPVIVQQNPEQIEYDQDFDRIGFPAVRRRGKKTIESFVDVDRPALFAETTHGWLGDSWHKQLNYTWWYPEHPPMAAFDPEAGHTEGVMLRITLDLHNKPLLAETAFACGCFHRIFPVEALEREATETHGRIVAGHSALVTKRRLAVDPIVAQSMGSFDPANPHPHVYVYGGKHFACSVEFGGPLPAQSSNESYSLADPAECEVIALEEGFASFFDRNGIVRGSLRPESTIMFPAGFLHAGAPRVRGMHLIHFDQYDYGDPQLLEKLLRLPPTPFLENIDLSPYSRIGTEAGLTPALDPEIKRADKKGFFCPC